MFLATLFTPMFGGVYDMPDGTTREMYYNGPVPCKYNAAKKCDSCGKCLQETWERTDARGQIMPCQAPDLGII